MGWWNADKKTGGIARGKTGAVWGDEPADALDSLMRNYCGSSSTKTKAAWTKFVTSGSGVRASVDYYFLRSLQRPATTEELRRGAAFAYGSRGCKALSGAMAGLGSGGLSPQPSHGPMRPFTIQEVADLLDGGGRLYAWDWNQGGWLRQPQRTAGAIYGRVTGQGTGHYTYDVATGIVLRDGRATTFKVGV